MQLHAHATPVGSLDVAGWSADAFYRRMLAVHSKLFFDGSCWLVVGYDVIKRIVFARDAPKSVSRANVAFDQSHHRLLPNKLF
jgi:hypothetical protein